MTEKRYTIGVLPNWQVYNGSLPDTFLVTVFNGMRAAAQKYGCNLLFACGVKNDTLPVDRPAWPEDSGENDFVPVGPGNTDGLVVILPFLSAEREAYIAGLRAQGFPILYLGYQPGLMPAVYIDDAAGVRLGCTHLYRHGHRKIAFIAGENGEHADGSLRVQSFQSTMKDLGLESNESLTAHSQKTEAGGFLAMQEILRRGNSFTAVMTCSDHAAIGAMRALQEAGKAVPGDVAVMGMGDLTEGMAQIPPIASIHYPKFEVGFQAIDFLMAIFQDGSEQIRSETVQLKPSLVTRQSCGCLPVNVTGSFIDCRAAREAGVSPVSRHSIVNDMVASLRQEAESPDSFRQARWYCERMLELFETSLPGNDPVSFGHSLVDLLHDMEIKGFDPFEWNSVLATLRSYRECLARSTEIEVVEDFFHLAQELFSESARRASIRIQIDYRKHLEQLGLMTIDFLSAHDEKQVVEVFQRRLREVGVRCGWLVTYEADSLLTMRKARLWISGRRTGGNLEGAGGRDFSPPAFATFQSQAFPPAELVAEAGEDPYAFVLLPMKMQEEMLGFLVLDSADLRLGAMLVRELGAALRSARLYERITILSITDGLTGVFNRRHFDLFLEKMVQHCRRYGGKLAVLLFDLDYFKQYNDQYGHPAGDDALCEVARCTRNSVFREADVIARYGGDEFALILPETDAAGALVVAENIRKEIAHSVLFLRRVTLSIGVAADEGRQMNSSALLRAVDQALYLAKERGRDNISLAELSIS